MAGMNNLKDVSSAFKLQNVQVSGDRVKAGFDAPAITAPTPVPGVATPAPAPVAAPGDAITPVPDTAATKSLLPTAARKRRTNATILGNGDNLDTLG